MGSSILRQANQGLLIVAVVLALYVIGAPFLPQANFYALQLWNRVTLTNSETQMFLPYHRGEELVIPTENRLLVPQMGVDGQIYDGRGIDTLQKGIWHRPRTSTPDKGSNTVLVAHRFLYTTGDNTFYNLDKVKVDDIITLFWNGKEYRYRVVETAVVLPTALEIEKPTKDPILTLYTCTPLLTGVDRLVVRARLIEPS